MPDGTNRPTFVQLGDHNTQHNHYYGPSVDPSTNDDTGYLAIKNLDQFALVARLAKASKHAGVANAVMEQMGRRAFRRSGPVADLLICLHLAPTIAKHGDWQLRRAFSHALGHTLAATGADGEVVNHIFSSFIELARASENFSVMLSIATTADYSTAQLLRNSAKGVYEYLHPQVLWQHSRYPSLCLAHTGLQPLIDSALDREDPWIKRRLVSSCLLGLAQGSLTDIEDTRRLMQALNDEDAQFLSLVLAWIEPVGRFDLSNLLQPSLLNEIKNNHAAITRRDPGTLLTADTGLVRMNLELMSLDMDLQKQKTSPAPTASRTPISGDSKGRYSTIEDVTAYLLGSAHQEMRERLVLDLLDSFDEGIRWAVASQFDLGLPQGQIGDEECAQIFSLLADSHPWVIRESLTTLARCDLKLSEPNMRELARRAVAAVPRTQTQGWPRTELMPALVGLLASEPAVAEYVDLAVRN
ncbi:MULTISPECIES: hypothetical protein [unclassified Streptomyces]|uniref:hypothetical protein n=1 Tax=unclassified Streptomyces TaxID=2593676 RepID=UPI001BAF2C74|nr:MULTISPECIES: hypothetical protein [unclassified Streptomyces]QUW92915.1 hypothetical protein KE639_04159 [Streptomyces sp. V17-9]WKX19494.1 hypothetical protein Q3Y68_16160 [Streptomyces sp. HUAS CX7]